MSAQARSTRLDIVELNRLVELYDLERHLFEVVSQRFREKQTLSSRDFFAIVIWKSNRTKTKIKDGLAAVGKSASELMKEVGQAESPKAKVEKLVRIGGIGLPIASAILAVCYPGEFTVLDYRAWQALQQASVEDLPAYYPRTPEKYLQYCRACSHFADRMGLSLRDLDRALWAKNWEDDLLDLINKTVE